jgi:RNA 3'-terminal phosphate cyclase (ATP)
MLTIDGSLGEGGGQVLRTSLSLAQITGRSFTMTNVRRHRVKPGLMPQHLKAVEAAGAVGMARVQGAQLGSQNLVFEPTGIRPGEFQFDIGTAGSSSLVLQTLLPPLSFARASSRVSVIGGTHVPWSPCFHFLEWHWLPYMRRIGFQIRLALDAAGFYPRGGGRVRAAVDPAGKLAPLRLTHRGALKRIRGISGVAGLDIEVAERQRRQALRRLTPLSKQIEIEMVQLPSPSRGTFVLLLAEFEDSQGCFCGLGARGKPAERVADEAADGLLDFVGTDGAVDPHLADQLVLPLALAPGPSELRTSRVTQHLLTNAAIVKMFLPVAIEIEGQIGQPGFIRIGTPG